MKYLIIILSLFATVNAFSALPDVRIQIEGTSKDTFDFGPVYLGNYVVKNVTITNLGALTDTINIFNNKNYFNLFNGRFYRT